MSEPFLSEIRMTAFPFVPQGWAACDGQIMAINQNQALYALIGNIYGGDGRTTFALPNLRDRVPIHRSDDHPLGAGGGESHHRLTLSETPTHTHTVRASNSEGSTGNPAERFLAMTGTVYARPANTTLHPDSVGASGEAEPHPNEQPFLTLNFIIALQGIFPSHQ